MAPGRVVYGIGPIRELLASRAGSVAVVYVAAGREENEIATLARARGIDVEERTRPELDELAGRDARHQGAVAIAGDYEYADLDELLARAGEGEEPGLLVALDGVQDPHNLGAIVRSAYLFGADGVIIPRDRAAGVTSGATKASAGATERIGIARVTNLARALERVKKEGFWTAAVSAGEGATPIWELDGTSPVCLVFGAEGSGIRPLVAKKCDFRVEIPMRGRAVGSLNVSVAAGAALFEIARQRSGAGR